MSEKKRYSHIDLMECIAIFFVVAYHGTIYSYDILRDSSVTTYLLYYGRTVLSACVPLFFTANGYLLLGKDFDLNKHIRKTVRLVLLVFIWGLLLMFLYMLIAGEPLSIKTAVMAVLNKDFDWNMNYFWFIGSLVCIYILFPALKALYDRSEKSFIFFTAVCTLFAFGFPLINHLLVFFGKVFHQNSVNINNFPMLTMFDPFNGIHGYVFVYFCFGGLLKKHEAEILRINKVLRNSVAAVGLLVSCVFLFLIGVFYSKYVNGALWDPVWTGYDSIFTLLNVLFIYLLCLNYKGDNKLIKAVSCNTLGIYFMHALFLKLMRPLIEPHEALCNFPINLVYVCLIICVCLPICIVLKKIPILKKLV